MLNLVVCMFKMLRYIFGHRNNVFIYLASHIAAFWLSIVACVASFAAAANISESNKNCFQNKDVVKVTVNHVATFARISSETAADWLENLTEMC